MSEQRTDGSGETPPPTETGKPETLVYQLNKWAEHFANRAEELEAQENDRLACYNHGQADAMLRAARMAEEVAARVEPAGDNPLAPLAGKYAHEPLWDAFQQAIQDNRREQEAFPGGLVEALMAESNEARLRIQYVTPENGINECDKEVLATADVSYHRAADMAAKHESRWQADRAAWEAKENALLAKCAEWELHNYDGFADAVREILSDPE